MIRTLLLTFLLLSPVAGSFASDFDARILSEINLARTQPKAYAAVVAERGAAIGKRPRSVAETVRFLQKQKPTHALTLSAGLTQ